MIDRICSLLKMKKPELNRGLLFSSGATVPSDGTDGYQSGCIFQHTDGGAGTALYVNEGSVTSCAFKAVEPVTSINIADLADVGATAYTAGSILVGDGNSYEEVAVSQDATLAANGALTVTVVNGVTPGTAAASKAVVLDSAKGISGLGLTSVALTETGATPATARLVQSELTLTPATSLAIGSSGSLVAMRGCVTLTTGKSITDGYLYGVQGKFVGDGATIAVGSDHVAGVLAQMSGSSMTVTNGHVGILVVSGQSLPTSADINAIYVESGGGTINSVLQSNCNATFFVDVNNFESCGIVATPAGSTASGDLRTLKVQIDGATYYILAAGAYGE